MRSIIIFITIFSFLQANAQTIPYAGESVWYTKRAFVPGTDISKDTAWTDATKSVVKSILKTTIDIVDTVNAKVRWVITDKVFQFTLAGVKIWKIDSAAIAADGQSATYDITLIRTMDFSEKPEMANHPKGAAKPRPVVTQKATLMILCPEGQFSEILLIGTNNFTTFQ